MDAVRRVYCVTAYVSRHGDKGITVKRKKNNSVELVDVKITNNITQSISSIRYPLQPEKGTHNPPHFHTTLKIKKQGRGRQVSYLWAAHNRRKRGATPRPASVPVSQVKLSDATMRKLREAGYSTRQGATSSLPANLEAI